jgi:hypothetical protein
MRRTCELSPLVWRAVALSLALAATPSPATAQQDLAKAAQNPVAAMISVPFQNNTNFGYGPESDVQNVLNIQPVWPLSLSPKWNVISRTIVPVLYQPDLVASDGGTFGISDINETLFLSPVGAGKVIWGLGVTATFPTTSDHRLGSEKWSAGPALVVLTMPGKWVLGFLTNNQWSYAGADSRADVNAFLLQYFVNYNLQRGWYLTSSPINTAAWDADSEDRWTVPVGGGVGKIFKAGEQALNAQAGVYFNALKPDNLATSDWTLRLQLQLLFPK